MFTLFSKLKFQQVRLPIRALSLLLLLIITSQAVAEKNANGGKEVVVSASRVPVAANRVGSSVTVISAKDIKESQATSVADLLRNVAGVTVSQTGARGGFTQVRIRGAEGNHTLVIIDGVEVNNTASGSEFDFAHLLIANIKRIEVLRAPQSAIYGSDAIGGVIMISTKGGTTKPVSNFSVEGGTYNTTKVTASTRGGSQKFKYSVGASRFKTDGFSAFNERRGFTEDDGYKNETVNIKVNYSMSDILDFSFVLRNSKGTAETDSIAFGVGPADSNNETFIEQTSGRFGIKLDLFDGRWTHKLSFGESQTDTDFSTDNLVTFLSRGKKQKVDYQNSFIFGSDNSEHVLVTALEREREKSLSGGATFISRDITNYGYAFEYRHSYQKKLFTSLSYRFDDNDIFKNAQTGRVTLAYIPSRSNKYRVHASYGTGVKNPTFFELFGSTTTFTGNPNLSPEKAKGYDAGIEFKLYSKKLTLDFTYFNRDITDLITGSGNTAINLAGKSPTEGLEVAMNWSLSSTVKFNANYTFLNAKTSTGEQQRRRPRHKLYLGLNIKPSKRTAINFNLVHNAGRVQNLFDAFFSTTRVDLKNYTVANTALRYKISKKLSVNARVENLFDEQYEEIVTYGTSGRAFYLGINARF